MTLRFVSKKLAKTNWTCFSQNLVVVPSIAPHRRQGTFLETPLAPYPKPESTWPPVFAKCLPPKKISPSRWLCAPRWLVWWFRAPHNKHTDMYTVYHIPVCAYLRIRQAENIIGCCLTELQETNTSTNINMYSFINIYIYIQRCKKIQGICKSPWFQQDSSLHFPSWSPS